MFDDQSATGILYGGYSTDADFGDIWLLDYRDSAAPQWSRVDPADSEAVGAGPGARSGHSAVWDAAGRRMVVYGGTRRTDDGGIAFLGDAWALALTPTAPPAPVIFLPATLQAFDWAAEVPAP